jgi:4,5-dihydroxyphthalate decarboxylase
MPLSLRTALVTRGHTVALKDRSVQPRGCTFDFEEVPQIIQAFRRMVRGLEFDVCEMAITTYLCAREHGKRFTAIPVFPMRAFHHGAIVCNSTSGIREPKDLEGRKVGVNRGYTVTTGVWARAILQHEYGVDLDRITWVLSGDEHVAEYQPPANVVPVEAGQKLEDLLVSGEVPAAIGVQVRHPDVKPLIANAADAGLASLRDRGLYPINHTVVVKDDLLAAHPGLARDLFDAFVAAKRPYLRWLADSALTTPPDSRLPSPQSRAPNAGSGVPDPEPRAPSPDDAVFARVMEVTGDPLPYGIEPNRQMIEAVIRYAHEQGILERRPMVEEVFAPGTLGSSG